MRQYIMADINFVIPPLYMSYYYRIIPAVSVSRKYTRAIQRSTSSRRFARVESYLTVSTNSQIIIIQRLSAHAS